MSNSNHLVALRRLRAELLAGRIGMEEACQDFERLTLLLDGIDSSEEQVLRSLVNDMERVRFTLLPENQPAAANEIFIRAEGIFAGRV